MKLGTWSGRGIWEELEEEKECDQNVLYKILNK